MKTIMITTIAIIAILMIGVPSAFALMDTEKEAGIASDAQGRACIFGLYHDQCLKQFIQEVNKPRDDWMSLLPIDNNTGNDTPGPPGDNKRTLPTGDACYDAGLDDGKHGEFAPYTFGDYCGPTSPEHHTENRYYRGFIDGLGHALTPPLPVGP